MRDMLGFPKTRGAFWGDLIMRIVVFWGLYALSPISADYHIDGLCKNSTG